MKKHSVLATLLAASTILAGAAYAADQPATPSAAASATQSAPQQSAAQRAVDRDVLKLSNDGAGAFQDMHMARIALFNANPAQAKALIGKAQGALSKAKTDESVFTKAEADLKQPAAKTVDQSAKAKAGGTASAGPEATKPVTWLPVDGQLTLGEDFVATPQKSAAVADANTSLAKGDQKGAVDKLKLAGIDVNFTMAVLPLDRTTADVDQAANLLDQGKYYEANAVLKQAEDGMRFDTIDTTALPRTTAAAAPGSKDSQAAAASTGTAKPAAH